MHDFLNYLIDYYGIKKPVTLAFEEEILFPSYIGNEIKHCRAQGTAAAIPADKPIKYKICLATAIHRNKYNMLATLAHEFGHIVQYDNGRNLEAGTDWNMEIEASKITNKVYREYLKIKFPKILAKLGKPSDPPEWVQEKMVKVQKVNKENIQPQKPVEQRYQLVSCNGEVYKIPL